MSLEGHEHDHAHLRGPHHKDERYGMSDGAADAYFADETNQEDQDMADNACGGRTEREQGNK